jgi:hypothetical protein
MNNTLKIIKILKYILIFIIIYSSIIYIPEKKLNIKEVFIISSIASITFAILDIISPSIKINKNKLENK